MEEKVPCAECGEPVSVAKARERNGLSFTCNLKHQEKVPCAECGKPVPAKQAAKRQGFCLHCSLKRNPFFVLYSSLVERVYRSPAGFAAFSDEERLYYAMTLFQNEVNNGGFHQFFFNSSGSYYEMIESGLLTLDEPQTLDLLAQAKQILFPEIAVPVDMGTRRKLLPAPSSDLKKRLDELDRRFYSTPDTLTPKLEAFARRHGLVPTAADSTRTLNAELR